MNWYAVASYGCYATEPVTAGQRAALAVSFGLLDTFPQSAAGVLRFVGSGLIRLGLGLQI